MTIKSEFTQAKCIQAQFNAYWFAMLARSYMIAGLTGLAIEHQDLSAIHANRARMFLERLVWGSHTPGEAFV